MQDSRFQSIAHYILLGSLLLILIFPIILSGIPEYTRLFFNVFMFVIVLSGVSIISEAYRIHRFVRFLLMLVVASAIANFLSSMVPALKVVVQPVISIYLLALTVVLIISITRSLEVSRITLVNAMSGYLLMGISGSIFIGLIEEIIPGAYSINIDDTYGVYGRIYHSFVTLTTLGYGDIAPACSEAQAFAVLLSTAGVFYMGFLVALLIGVFIAKEKS